ncbi:hypothetical protein [Gluconobacter sp.]|uniref:hypothetical protein n=1 Tax=Gluconobacter sp. TaxID=1876758 RepID=UPI0039E9AB03
MSNLFSAERNIPSILYTEDFDSVSKFKIEKNEDIPAVVEVKKNELPSKEVLDEYYNKGLREGRRLEKEISDNEKLILEDNFNKNILCEIKEIKLKIDEQKREISREVSFVIFKALINLFPNILAQYGAEESKKIFEKITPFLNENYRLKLTCSKDLFGKIKMYFPSSMESEMEINLDEEIKDGEFKLSWGGGYLVRNAEESIKRIISDIFLLLDDK